jgi:sugar lactone lactonase YvrE
MKGICKMLVGISLCLGLLWPAAAQGAPPELYRFPQLEEGVLGGQLFLPTAIGVNRENGAVYVADSGNSRISQYKSEGEFVRSWGWGVVRSGPDNKPGNERQEVALSAAAGSFRLVFRDFLSQIEDHSSRRQTTAPLPFDATASEVQAALEALETPEPGDVAVSGAAGGPWTVEFTGNLADVNLGMEIGESTLKEVDDSPGTATVKTLQDGAAFEVCEAAAGDVCRGGQEDGYAPGRLNGVADDIAVDAEGAVYVLETKDGKNSGGEPDSARIEKFSPEGEFLLMAGGEVDKTTGADVCTRADLEVGDQCGYGVVGEGPGELSLAPSFHVSGDGLAVGPDGKLYVGDKERIVVYGSDGAYQGEIPVAGDVRGLTIDEAGNFYLSYAGQDDVYKLTSAGLPGSPASFPVNGGAIAIAVDGLGDVYMTENSDCNCAKYVAEFDSLGNRLLPTAQEVKKRNFFARRENGVTFDYDLLGLENLLCEDGSGAGVLYVSDTSGHVSGYGEDPQCIEGARPPTIVAQLVRSVSLEGAVLSAQINPRRAPTTYYLEYGTADCAANPCTRQPLPPGLLLSAEGIVAVASEEIELSGLDPGTTYHFRFVAENGEVAVGPDRTFTTPRAGAGGLLDGRAWEKVSPAEKGSGQVAQEGGTRNELLQASPEGNAISYPGSAAFGDPPGAPGGNFYLSRRGAGGWATRNVTPPRQGGGIDSPMHGFSRDLSHYLMMVEEPPLCCGASPGIANYYLADSEGGPLQLLTDVPPVTAGAYCLSPGGASADFSRIFFRAEGALTPEAPVGPGELYEWTAAEGLQLVSVLPGGAPAPPGDRTNFGSSDGCPPPPSGKLRYRAISEDGSHAVWTYGGSYEGATEPLLDRVGGSETVRLDAPQGVAGTGGEGNYLGAGADGAAVFFNSPEPLTPDGAKGGKHGDLYRYDFTAAPGERLSDLTPGGGPAVVQGTLGVAADGEAIYFVATAALSTDPGAALDGKTGQPQVAEAGKQNLYLWRQGEGIRFIAQLSRGDVNNWESNPGAHVGEVTPDGEHALLLTAEPLTSYENLAAGSEARLKEAFLYDAAENRLTCVSCNPTGAQPRGEAALTAWKTPFEPPRVLSDEGRRVFFESSDALVEADRNEARDVYEFERAGSGSCTTEAPSYQLTSEGCLGLVSSGAEGAADSYFLDASTNGDDVFLSTLEQLVGADEDELYDVYDARVGGGLPEPPPPPPGCEGEACRGAGTGSDSGPGPATGTFSGPGNQPRLHCPKGKIARKGHCVNRKTKKHHRPGKHHRAAKRAGGNR